MRGALLSPTAKLRKPEPMMRLARRASLLTGMGTTMSSALAQRKCEERKKQTVLAVPEKPATEHSCLPDLPSTRAGPRGSEEDRVAENQSDVTRRRNEYSGQRA